MSQHRLMDSSADRKAPQGAFAFSERFHLRTAVYVDGFNLYYGCLKGTPHKWLNPSTLDPVWREFALGVYRLEGRLMVILDVERLLGIEPQ